MNALIHTLLTLICLSLSTNLSAYPEIPFCPAGGAPGWMNYIDYKRNQNRWQQSSYPAYSPATAYTGYYYPLSNTTPSRNSAIAPRFNHTLNRYSAPNYPYSKQPNYYKNTNHTPAYPRNHSAQPIYQTR